jgi:hypothetical protein
MLETDPEKWASIVDDYQEEEPAPPVVKAVPVAPKAAPKPKAKTLEELMAMTPAQQEKHLRSVGATALDVQQCVLEGLKVYTRMHLVPMRSRIEAAEAENVRLRGEVLRLRDLVNSAVRPFVAQSEPQDGDSERWQ